MDGAAAVGEARAVPAASAVPLQPSSSSSASNAMQREAVAATHRIHSALAPRIAVLTSADVDETLAPNNIDTFADLLRPFQESIERISVRTSQLETRQCATFPLSFDHLDSFAPAKAASTASLFTPADLVQDGSAATTAAGQAESNAAAAASPSSAAKRRNPVYTRPEILLDAISARISSKSKALWESGGSSIRSKGASQARNSVDGKDKAHRRKDSMYQADAVLAFAEESEAVDLERYRTQPIDRLTPWFADTRDMVLDARPVSEHETFGHPLAVLLVVSSASSDPMNAFATLFDASQAHANATFSKRPYVDPLVFRYYVLLHDVSKSGTEMAESTALLDNVKKTYGLHCCLLTINSANSSGTARSGEISALWQQALRRPSGGAVPDGRTSLAEDADEATSGSPAKSGRHSKMRSWHAEETSDREYGALLDDDDIRRIRGFVRDFSAQSLVPFMERCVSLWNEQLAASRRGLTGRLLGAGRKFFGGSLRGSSSTQGQPAPASYSTLGYYPHASLEAQTRRLADFAFMTRDYKLAASMYDIGRRDYANDKANKYIAGANEMFGLSHLMTMLETRSQPIDVDSYLAAAGAYYLLAPRQKGSALQLDSLRATLLFYEAYRALHFYRPVPNAMVRTANEGSGEAENDLEVVAGMLLEQAALADLRQPGKPALRKCALHLVMAAHRYRACGQKHLSLRCFQASSHFYNVLRRAAAGTTAGGQPEVEGTEDGQRLGDLIAAHEDVQVGGWDLISDHMEHEMAQQAFNDGDIAQAAVHYVAILQRQASTEEATHAESALRHESYMQGLLTCCKYLDRPLDAVLEAHGMKLSLSLLVAKHTYIEVNASAQRDDAPWRRLEEQVLGRSVSTAYKTQNTTAVGETFWVHVGVRNPLNMPLQIGTLSIDLVDAADGKRVDATTTEQQIVSSVMLEPLEMQSIAIEVVCRSPRTLRCTGVRYRLADQIDMYEDVTKHGRRLNETREQQTSNERQYAPNESLAVIVHESKAILEARMVDAPSRLCLGEEMRVDVQFVNAGKAPLGNVRMHLNRPDTLLQLDAGFRAADSELHEVSIENSLRLARAIKVPLGDDKEVLQPGESSVWPMLLRGSALGFMTLRVLIVFESQKGGETVTAQMQHTMQVEPVLDLAIQAGPAQSEDARYHLRLEAMNLLSREDKSTVDAGTGPHVVIDRLSFIAPAWTASIDATSSAALEPLKGIPAGERRGTNLHVGYVAPRADGDSQPITDLRFAVEQLRSLLTGRGVDPRARPPPTSVQLSCLAGSDGTAASAVSPFLLLARREYRLAALARDFPSLLVTRDSGDDGGSGVSRREEEQLEALFTLYEPSEIDVVAHWRIAGVGIDAAQQRTGQSFIFGLHLGPLHDYLSALFIPLSDDKVTRTIYAQTEREKAAVWNEVRKSRLHAEEDPILLDFAIIPPSASSLTATPTATTAVSHDFDAQPRMLLDVQLIVRNLSALSTRDVVLQLDNVSPPAGGAAAAVAAASAAAAANSSVRSPLPPVYGSYVGRLTLRAQLAPMTRTVLTARVSVGKPGRVFIAPVLVRNTNAPPVTAAAELTATNKDFHRWEYCPHVLNVVHKGSSS